MIVLKINITNKSNCWTLADLCPCAMQCIEFYDIFRWSYVTYAMFYACVCESFAFKQTQ